MRAASVRLEAPARAAGPRDARAAGPPDARDARATIPARRWQFPRTRVAAGAGTVIRVASKRCQGPGRPEPGRPAEPGRPTEPGLRAGPGSPTTRPRWTRLRRRTAPVTTPVPASPHAQANARAPVRAQTPAKARAPARARTPAGARLRVAIRPQATARSGGRTDGGPGSRTVHRTGWSWGSRTMDTYHPDCPPGAVRRRGACPPPGSDPRQLAFRRHHRSRLSPNRDRSDILPCAVPFPALPTYQAIYPHRLCVGGHFTRGNQVSGRAVGGIGAGS